MTYEADRSNKNNDDGPLSFSDVTSAEADHIRETMGHKNRSHFNALCLSGGGIRSASFCLGVMRGLAKSGHLLNFDYLSVVSGGGFSGAWMARRIQQLFLSGKTDSEVQTQLANETFVDEHLLHLRRNSNYLTPRLGVFSLDSLTGALIYFRNFLVNFFLISLIALTLVSAVNALALFPVHYPITIAGSFMLPVALAIGLFLFLCGYAIMLGQAPRTSIKPRLKASNLANQVSKSLQWQSVAFFFASYALTVYFVLSVSNGTKIFSDYTVTNSGFFSNWVSSDPFLSAFSCGDRNCFEYEVLFVGIILFSVAALYVNYQDWLAAQIDISRASIHQGITWGDFWPHLIEAVMTTVVMIAVVSSLYGYVERQQICSAETIAKWMVVVGPLLVSIVHKIAQMFQLIVTSKRRESDLFREWLSRFMAARFRLPVLWLFLSFAALFSSEIVSSITSILSNVFDSDMFSSFSAFAKSMTAFVGTLAGIAAPFLAIFASRKTKSENDTDSMQTRVARIVTQISSLIVGFMAVIFFSATISFWAASVGDTDAIVSSVKTFTGSLVTLLVISLFVYINRFSAHDIYRNRLVRTFLGGARTSSERIPDPYTNFDPVDDFSLFELSHQLDGKKWKKTKGPLLIFNAAMNAGASKDLAWQERKSLPFTFSSLHSGSSIPHLAGDRDNDESGGVYRRTKEYGGGISTGSAMAISGAAFNSAMGSFSSPILTMITTVFNARLGVWLGNPADKHTWRKRCPTSAAIPLVREFTGRTNNHEEYVNISDGGHFDNLGVYEMLKRKCRIIVAIDSGADPSMLLCDLGKAIRLAKLDMKEELRVDFLESHLDELSDKSNGRSVAIAKVTFGNSKNRMTGVLLLLKPKVTKNAPAQVRSYVSANSDFPHESTADQWFSESQFNSYIELGEQLAAGLASELESELIKTLPSN